METKNFGILETRWLKERDDARNIGDVAARYILIYLLSQKDLNKDLCKILVNYVKDSGNFILQFKLGLIKAEKIIYNDVGNRIDKLAEKNIKNMIELDLSNMQLDIW